MTRRLITLAALLSLALCLAFVILWLNDLTSRARPSRELSYRIARSNGDGYHLGAIYLVDGSFYAGVFDEGPLRDQRLGLSFRTARHWGRGLVCQYAFEESHGDASFGIARLPQAAFPFRSGTYVVCPRWLVAAALAAMPILWASLYLRRSAWFKHGRCKNCGYDLRVTRGRCPECGAVPAEAKA